MVLDVAVQAAVSGLPALLNALVSLREYVSKIRENKRECAQFAHHATTVYNLIVEQFGYHASRVPESLRPAIDSLTRFVSLLSSPNRGLT